MNSKIYTHKININYSDVDENNQITNKGFLRLLQEVAGINVSLYGYGVNDIDKTNVAWIILNWKLKVISRPKTNTELTINTWTYSENSLFSFRSFEIYNDNTLVAFAISKWVLFDVKKKRITKLLPDILDKDLEINKPLFDEPFNQKLKELDNSIFLIDYAIQRRDIDTNHHVNNLYYLDYAYEALPYEIYKNNIFSNVEIMYKHEAKLGDIVSIFYNVNEKNEYIITIKNKANNSIHAVIKLY